MTTVEKSRQAEAQHKGAQLEAEGFKAHLGLDRIEMEGQGEMRKGEERRTR